MTDWRTHAYEPEDRRNYRYLFWVMSPAYKKPGYQIRKHEIGQSGSTITRIADELPEHEALLRMAQLDEQAGAKLKRIDDADDNTRLWLGADYKRAELHEPRTQAIIAELNNAKLRLRNKDPKFRLKP